MAYGVLDQSFLQISNVAFGLTIRGGVIEGRCNGLNTVSVVKCPDLVGHDAVLLSDITRRGTPNVAKSECSTLMATADG